MNSSGKVLSIFLVIIAVLLISLTAISLFFFQKEIERRKLAEMTVEEFRVVNVNLENDLKEAKKKNFLLEEKVKEADERVNDLSDELELEKGLREEMKIQEAALTEKVGAVQKEKEQFAVEVQEIAKTNQKLKTELMAFEMKVKELEAQVKAQKQQSQQVEARHKKELEAEAAKQREAQAVDDSTFAVDVNVPAPVRQVELEEIVVEPQDAQVEPAPVPDLSLQDAPVQTGSFQGRILSIDTETEFVIVNIGTKDGLKAGYVLSVYRDEEYLGDIKITRLQPEMSAADLISPLSILKVQRNDQVRKQ